MDIDIIIDALTKMRDDGVKRVFVLDSTNNRVLDVVEVGTDDDGDGIIQAD